MEDNKLNSPEVESSLKEILKKRNLKSVPELMISLLGESLSKLNVLPAPKAEKPAPHRPKEEKS